MNNKDKGVDNFTPIERLEVPKDLGKEELFDLWMKYSDMITFSKREVDKKKGLRIRLQGEINALIRKREDATDRLDEVVQQVKYRESKK